MKKTDIAHADVPILLRDVKILRYLDDTERRELFALCELQEYDIDDCIVKEGEIDSYFYIIIDGTVSVLVTQQNAKDVYICTLGKNEVFGEAALFMNIPRTAKIVASVPTTVLRIARHEFLDFIKKNTKGGFSILMLIIYSLLKKLREANQELAFERKGNYEQEMVDALIDELMADK